jgi:hypothetical protein
MLPGRADRDELGFEHDTEFSTLHRLPYRGLSC